MKINTENAIRSYMVIDGNIFYDRIGIDGKFQITHDDWFMRSGKEHIIVAKNNLTDFALIDKKTGKTIIDKHSRYTLAHPLSECTTIYSYRMDGSRYSNGPARLYRGNVVSQEFYMLTQDKYKLLAGPFEIEKDTPVEFDGWIKVKSPLGGYNYINEAGDYLLDHFVDNATNFQFNTAGIWDNGKFSIINSDKTVHTENLPSTQEAFPHYDNQLAYCVNDNGDVTLIRKDKSIATLKDCKIVKWSGTIKGNSSADPNKEIPRLLLVSTNIGFVLIDLHNDQYLPLNTKDRHEAATITNQKTRFYKRSNPIDKNAVPTERNCQIVCAFNCEGKAEFVKTHKNAVNLERDFFYYKVGGRLPETPSYDDVNFVWARDHFQEDNSFPENLIAAINKVPASIEYILLTASKDVLCALKDAEMEYTLVIPEPEGEDLPEWYLDRYESRIENSPRFDGADTDTTLRNQLFDEERAQYRVVKRIGEQETMHGCKGIVYTTENEYLSDVIDQIK